MKKLLIGMLLVVVNILLVSCSEEKVKNQKDSTEKNTEASTEIEVQTNKPEEDYGVFLSLDNSDLSIFLNYKIVVIDAQYFDKTDIDFLHENGVEVYSYLNIGSLENFRDYYNTYDKYTLEVYENWEEEKWVDVSVKVWQDFITDELANKLFEKGIDGFFIDNCDVYYIYNETKIYNGLETILRKLKNFNVDVVINGGDEFVNAYYENNNSIEEIITGINQEDVFTSYDFDNEKFETANSEDSLYYKEYIEKFGAMGTEIFLLEYTDDFEVINQIENYCKKYDFMFYVSDSIELD